MVNLATEKALMEMETMEAAIGTGEAAKILGVSPKGFKRYLENCEVLPHWAIEVTDEGERRTFRVLTERFAAYLVAKDIPTCEVEQDDLPM